MLQIFFIAVAYIIGGAFFAYSVNRVHRQKYGEGIKGVALKRAIFPLIFWPITLLAVTFPPTARYIETGSFKR